jgi:hypothetical protein
VKAQKLDYVKTLRNADEFVERIEQLEQFCMIDFKKPISIQKMKGNRFDNLDKALRDNNSKMELMMDQL